MKILSAPLIACLWLPMIQKVEGNKTETQSGECITFDSMPAKKLVEDVLKDPEASIEFKLIQASRHECFKHFIDGHVMGTHATTGDDLIFDEGIIMSTGQPEDFCWNDSDMHSFQWGKGGDEDLMSLGMSTPDAGLQTTYDACVIEFEFRCNDGSPGLSFGYIFGSDEYFEEGSGDYNDAFAFFLNGENIALLPDGQTMVSINNVNSITNAEYFIGNESDGDGIPYPNIEADGFTTNLSADGTLTDGWNKMKIVIADKSDNILDSYIILQAQSFTCVDVEGGGSPDTTSKILPEDLDESTTVTSTGPPLIMTLPENLDESTTTVASMLWYPNFIDPNHPYSCVNGDDYSDWMSLPSLSTPYLFDSEEDCCHVHYCAEPQGTQTGS